MLTSKRDRLQLGEEEPQEERRVDGKRHEFDAEENVAGPAILGRPGVAAVLGVHDDVTVTDRSAVISVHEADAVKEERGPAALGIQTFEFRPAGWRLWGKWARASARSN